MTTDEHHPQALRGTAGWLIGFGPSTPPVHTDGQLLKRKPNQSVCPLFILLSYIHYYLFVHSHSSQLIYATLTVLLTIYVAIILHNLISIILRGVV